MITLVDLIIRRHEPICICLILLMYMEVGPVRVLHPVFEEFVNNCGLNLYPFRSVK